MVLVSVFDKKMECFGAVFSARNVAVALRDFSQVCQDSNSQFAKFPGDYDFYLIASFDEETGKIEQKVPQVVATAEQFVNKEKKEVANGQKI